MCLFGCLPVRSFVRLFVYDLFVWLHACSFVCLCHLFVCLFACLFVYDLFVWLHACLFVCLLLFVCLFVYLFVCL